MPINSTQTYIMSLLDGLPMPNGGYNLEAYITPPDPEVDAVYPHAYIWPTTGDESRDPLKGGTVPRALTAGAPSGTKGIEHTIDIIMIWFAADDDPDVDTWFTGMVDAVMAVLRVAPNPAIVADTYTNVLTNLVDIGEKMTYHITVRALADQAYNRYDCLITMPVLEIIQS